ncbi:TraB/GumN family protein [Paraliomyxa miuraensis]|uniref:hypothetical protein n=1 Tax=Paraliomyxa miuraensis TaxID=376150 RepID=UPI002256DAE5|nr:hypothetical protein [Paraliomyxa miuraensis]MCX4240918.1 hypothetical protein [Paraliomyxa miuraensis]
MPRAPLLPIPLLVVSFATACRPASTTAEQPRDVPPLAVVTASDGPSPPTVECGAPIEGADTVLRAGGLVMLGELHGAREIPAFVADLACAGASRGLSVRVGMEIPRSEDEALAAFLDGAGAASDREALLDAEHWQRSDQDGRSSEATLALVERVRALRRTGLDVDLFAFDANAWSDWNERDSAMAERILARAAAEPEAMVLTLSGNLHNRTVVGLPWDPNAIPMGVHVQRARPDGLSLDVRYTGGTAWICQQEGCGIAQVSGHPEGAGRRIELRAEPDEYGHHGTFCVGSLEAAPPAVGQLDQ